MGGRWGGGGYDLLMFLLTSTTYGITTGDFLDTALAYLLNQVLNLTKL